MSHMTPAIGGDSNPPVKRRRGRQPRPSLLSSRVKTAVAHFASQVGQPRVIEPAGFRDFRGWLAFIAAPNAIHYWAPVVHAVLQDTDADPREITKIKPDLVREIVKAVVIPRDGESSKLVSTNCGRQCARPINGVTLMTILDDVFDNIRRWKEIIPTLINTSSTHHVSTSAPPTSASAPPAPSSQRHATTLGLPTNHHQDPHASQPRRNHSSSSRPWSNRSRERSSLEKHDSATPLPSFRELEDSIQSQPYLGKRQRR